MDTRDLPETWDAYTGGRGRGSRRAPRGMAGALSTIIRREGPDGYAQVLDGGGLKLGVICGPAQAALEIGPPP